MRNSCIYLLSFLLLFSLLTGAKTIETDICIYGGTSAGVVSAISADRLGKKAVLVESSNYIGGLSTSGLGETDIGNKFAVTGIARDFYRQIGLHYGKFEMWKFEPHVALSVFENFLKTTNVEVIKNYELSSVVKTNGKIQELQFASTNTLGVEVIRVKAKVYIDATYEGDLLAKAGVSYMLGREDNSMFGEKYNGIQLSDFHQFPDGISPYIIPNVPESGLCFGVSNDVLQPTGTGDNKLQAYNFRLCLTQNRSNFIPNTPPYDYDPSKYELLKRVIEHRTKNGENHKLSSYLIIDHMPNGKTDINNKGPFSTDLISGNQGYIDADFVTRQQIVKAHENYIKGLLFFLGNDSSVSVQLRNEMKSWGYAKDEFIDNGGFPHQMYVREGRRMIGEYVMTEHNCLGTAKVNDAIGMAAYTMDSHNCQRIVVNGMVKNEGDVQVGNFPPYAISYRSIIPQSKECSNLLVPVSLSASHIAFGSIRMEPVFMVLAQSAAVAASLAIDQTIPVQKVNVKQVQSIVAKNPYLDGRKAETIVDNSDLKQIKLVGNWQIPTNPIASNKMDYLMIIADGKTPVSAQFKSTVSKEGKYDVYLYCPEKPRATPEWAESIEVEVLNVKELSSLIINPKANRHDWIKLGRYDLKNKADFFVTIIA